MPRRKTVIHLPPTGRACPNCHADMGDEPWCVNCASNRRGTVGQRSTERAGLPIEIPGSGTFFRAAGRVYKVESKGPGKSSRRILATSTEIREVEEFENRLRLDSQLRSAVNSARVPGSAIQNLDAYCVKCKKRHKLFVNGVENKTFMDHMEQGHLDVVKQDIPAPFRPRLSTTARSEPRRQDRNPMQEFHSLVERQVHYIQNPIQEFDPETGDVVSSRVPRIRTGESVLDEMLQKRAEEKAGIPDPRLNFYIPREPCPICGTKHKTKAQAQAQHRLKVSPVGPQRREIVRRMQFAWQRAGGRWLSPAEADSIHATTGTMWVPGKQNKPHAIERPEPAKKTPEETLAEFTRQHVEHLERLGPQSAGIAPSSTIHERRPTKRERERYGAERNPHLPATPPKKIQQQNLEVKFGPGIAGWLPGRNPCPFCKVTHRTWGSFINKHPNQGTRVKEYYGIPYDDPIPEHLLAGKDILPTPGGGLRMAEHRDVMRGGPTTLNQGETATKLCPSCHMHKPAYRFASQRLMRGEVQVPGKVKVDICADCIDDLGDDAIPVILGKVPSIQAPKKRRRVIPTIRAPRPPIMPRSNRRQ